MISYKPLRDYLYENEIKISNLASELGISSTTATKLNKDVHVSLETIERICLHLELPIEQVVKIVESEPTER